MKAKEILFRGKGIDTKEWIYGYYSSFIPPASGKIVHYISDYGYRTVEVFPETVCQFIWLIDKTGRKIFEGDILKGHEGSIYRVWREKGGFSISDIELNDPFPSYPLCDKQIASYVEAGCEVIGNTYDNPELIK